MNDTRIDDHAAPIPVGMEPQPDGRVAGRAVLNRNELCRECGEPVGRHRYAQGTAFELVADLRMEA